MSKNIIQIVLVALLCCLIGQSQARSAAPVPSARQTQSFDADWRFLKADTPGAEQPGFTDADWRTVNVPHDWAIEGPFDQNAPELGWGAYLPTGIGWYRKHFTLPQADVEKRVFIDFDGVMANSDVWINGFHLGKRPYGYVSFRYELTDHLNYGATPNVIAVRADNSVQPASRWYAGAGIYRHVRLVVTDPVHIDHCATFISTPQVSPQSATVHVQSRVVNQGSVARPITLQVTLLGPDGKAVGTVQTPPQTVAAGGTVDFTQDITVKNPRLWNLDSPNLYRAAVRVQSAGKTLDDETTPFGIREFHFDAATGFWLNGKNFKIKGVCLHGDVGALGVAVPLSAWRKRLAALKPLGVNAIRTAHDPPSPEFLDLCDQMGFLVMDEFFDVWTVAKRAGDYHLYFTQWGTTDAHDTVLRDRNHPSIILYSAGNEIHDTPNAERSKTILASLLAVCHAADPTRPVTQALLQPLRTHDYDDGLADMLDVIGTNYHEQDILGAHAAQPSRKILGTENRHARDVWLALRDNPPYAGQFLWTGVDYLGESRQWPDIGSTSGLLDRTDAPRPRAAERQSWWSDVPMVSMARVRTAPPAPPRPPDPNEPPVPPDPLTSADWTPSDQTPHAEDVAVYSNCAQVELFLNGKSLGSQPLPADASPRLWHVAYAPGVLKAVGSNNGKAVATQELRTAGPAAKLALVADQNSLPADWDDVSYVRAIVEDAQGVPIPSASDLVHFQITGPGAIAAVDNADRASHESFQASERHAYQGQCVAILRATAPSGRITLTATAPGLAPASVTLQAKPASSIP